MSLRSNDDKNVLHTSIVQTGDVGWLSIDVFKLGEMMKDEKHLQSIKTVQVNPYQSVRAILQSTCPCGQKLECKITINYQ